MRKKILLAAILCGGFCLTAVSGGGAEERLPGYLQAEKFTKSKLDKMLFSTMSTRTGSSRERIFGLSIRPAKGSSGM